MESKAAENYEEVKTESRVKVGVGKIAKTSKSKAKLLRPASIHSVETPEYALPDCTNCPVALASQR